MKRESQIALLKSLARRPRTALQIQTLLALADRSCVTKRIARMKARGLVRIADWLRQDGRGGRYSPVYAPTNAGRLLAGLPPSRGTDEDAPYPAPLSQYDRDQRWKAGLAREESQAQARRAAGVQAVEATIAARRSCTQENFLWCDLMSSQRVAA